MGRDKPVRTAAEKIGDLVDAVHARGVLLTLVSLKPFTLHWSIPAEGRDAPIPSEETTDAPP